MNKSTISIFRRVRRPDGRRATACAEADKEKKHRHLVVGELERNFA
jgi:hypothetical protein